MARKKQSKIVRLNDLDTLSKLIGRVEKRIDNGMERNKDTILMAIANRRYRLIEPKSYIDVGMFNSQPFDTMVDR